VADIATEIPHLVPDPSMQEGGAYS
jgi:hypothetical protein